MVREFIKVNYCMITLLYYYRFIGGAPDVGGIGGVLGVCLLVLIVVTCFCIPCVAVSLCELRVRMGR